MKPQFTLIGVVGGALAAALHVAVCVPGSIKPGATGGPYAILLLYTTGMMMLVFFGRKHLAGVALGYLVPLFVGYGAGLLDDPGLMLGTGLAMCAGILAPLRGALYHLPEEKK